jgi:hypothetical protein
MPLCSRTTGEEGFSDVVFFHDSARRPLRGADLVERIDASFCMVFDGDQTYLTSNVRPLLQRLRTADSSEVMGAVWRAHRYSRSTDRWKGLLVWVRKLLPGKRQDELLSGLFIIEGGLSSTPKGRTD